MLEKEVNYDIGHYASVPDFIYGITVSSQVDEITGLSSTVVMDPKQRGAGGKDLRPVIKLVNAKGKEVCFANTDIPAVYALPAGALVNLEDGVQVSVGDVIAISPVVCRVSQTCSRPANRRIRRSSPSTRVP